MKTSIFIIFTLFLFSCEIQIFTKKPFVIEKTKREVLPVKIANTMVFYAPFEVQLNIDSSTICHTVFNGVETRYELEKGNYTLSSKENSGFIVIQNTKGSWK